MSKPKLGRGVIFVLREKKAPYRYLWITRHKGVGTLTNDLVRATIFHSLKEAKEQFQRSDKFINKHYDRERVYITTDRLLNAKNMIQQVEATLIYGNAENL